MASIPVADNALNCLSTYADLHSLFHQKIKPINTPFYGSVYIGDGIKNIDLPFSI